MNGDNDESSVGEDYTRVTLKDSDAIETVLAQELNQLSVQERDNINDEIHGVRVACPTETPELVQISLTYLEKELASLPSTPKKRAYEDSLKYPESYIHQDDFRLMFLRCEFFDVQKAAVRLIKYLDLIHYAFGPQILQREMSLADFDQKGKQFLREGYHQILPGTDRSGRRVVANFTFPIDPDMPIKNQVKSGVYLVTRLARDSISVQRKGVVGLGWTFGSITEDLKRRFWVRSKFQGTMPFRMVAIHVCFQPDDPIATFVRRMMLASAGAEHRKRIRIHIGSATECLYKLQTFGIQAIHMPINSNTGKVKVANHHKWLQLQKIMEDALRDGKECKGIECPEQADILFGRGWPKMNHPGNAHFRHALECRLDEYNAATSKKEKTAIAWSIVSELQGLGARFLREDESGFWMEVSNDVARQKVSIGFRDIRKARQKLFGNNKSISTALPTPKRKDPNNGSSSDEDSNYNVFLNANKRRRPMCAEGIKCL